VRGSSATRGGGTCGWTHGAWAGELGRKVNRRRCAQRGCHVAGALSSAGAAALARIGVRMGRSGVRPLVGQREIAVRCEVGPPYPPRTHHPLGVSTPGSADGRPPLAVVVTGARERTGTRRASATIVPGTRAGPCAQRNAPCARTASPMTIYVVSSPDSCYVVVVVRDNTATRGQRNDSPIR